MNITTSDEKYHPNKTTAYSCQYCISFCTKYRGNALVNGIDDNLKQRIHDRQGGYGYQVSAVGAALRNTGKRYIEVQKDV